MNLVLALLFAAATASIATAQNRPRGRDLGIPFPGQTGPMNAITDVAGIAATIEATEEAVVNAMLAAQTMTGADGIRSFGLPGDRVVEILKKYNRMK